MNPRTPLLGPTSYTTGKWLQPKHNRRGRYILCGFYDYIVTMIILFIFYFEQCVLFFLTNDNTTTKNDSWKLIKVQVSEVVVVVACI